MLRDAEESFRPGSDGASSAGALLDVLFLHKWMENDGIRWSSKISLQVLLNPVGSTAASCAPLTKYTE